jgi:hypothetical protein
VSEEEFSMSTKEEKTVFLHAPILPYTFLLSLSFDSGAESLRILMNAAGYTGKFVTKVILYYYTSCH